MASSRDRGLGRFGVAVGVEAVGGLFEGLEGGVVGEGSPEVVVAEEATQEDEVGEVPGGLGGVEEGFEVVDELVEPGETFGGFGEVDHGLGGVVSEVVEVGGGGFGGDGEVFGSFGFSVFVEGAGLFAFDGFETQGVEGDAADEVVVEV